MISIYYLKNIINKNREFILVIILYVIANFLMLLNNGIYWDDWVLYNQDPEILIDTFYQAGYPPTGYLHVFLLSFDYGIALYRILTFFSFLVAALCLMGLLRTIAEIGDSSRLIIVLIFALLPVNTAKITLICLPYALCYMFFFLGLWVLGRYLKRRKLMLRVFSLLLFALSFSTQSLLAFFLITICYIAYIEKDCINNVYSLFKMGLRYADFLLLPFVFFILKQMFWKPYGLYEGYTGINVLAAIYPIFYAKSILMTGRDILLNIIPFTLFELALFLVLLLLLTFFFYKKKYDFVNVKEYNHIFFLIGILIYLLAIFPYIAVGKIPSMSEWGSRDLLLIPLGLSFVLYFGAQSIFSYLKVKNIYRIVFFSVILSLFVVSGVSLNLDLQKDFYKQQSIIENMKDNTIMQSHTTFIFIDNVPEYDAFNRNYRFYEYSGLMKEAFQEETRFGYSHITFKGSIIHYEKHLNSHYNMGDYVISEPEYYIYIERGTYNLDNYFDILSLKYHDYFSKDDLNLIISEIISLTGERYFTSM